MTTTEFRPLAVPVEPAAIPPLENGDRLTRAEFERRYDAMPDVKKAELIEGVVYVSSPVHFEQHSQPHFYLVWWLATYSVATPGVTGGDNGTIELDLDNMPQPDGFLLIHPEHGGQARIGTKYIEGAPELAVEVASSSASYDLHDKKNAYRRNGVREYVVVRVLDREIDWFVLREGKYDALSPDEKGIYQSEVFPGLWLDGSAFLNGNFAQVAEVLQAGLSSPEHAEFVTKLRGNGGPSGS